MQKVDKKLIDLADILDFPLICMPENNSALRYSEVIGEVMDAILKDQKAQTYFQGEILERISRLPVYQRSIGTAMGMLSDRLRISLLLADADSNLLNSVYWPRNCETDAEGLISEIRDKDYVELDAGRLYIRHYTVNAAVGSRLYLYILKHDEAVKEDDAAQIVDVIRLCINLWSQSHGERVLPELVQAILKDEPFKMRRIAAAFNIDVSSIHNMWIISPINSSNSLAASLGKDAGALLSMVRRELSPYCQTIVADICHQDTVAFMDSPVDTDMLSLAAQLHSAMESEGISAKITVCLNRRDTTQVRRAYLLNQSALVTAQYIYPLKMYSRARK
jgi:hypothetical protein